MSTTPRYLSEGGEKCDELRKMFNKTARLTIKDGRVFIGIMNVLLLSTPLLDSLSILREV